MSTRQRFKSQARWTFTGAGRTAYRLGTKQRGTRRSTSRRRSVSTNALMTFVSKPLQIVRGACGHDCPDTCSWVVEVRDGIAERLSGDSEHPFTRGTLCAKVNHYLERVYQLADASGARRSVNVLTPVEPTDWGGGSGFQDAVVEVARVTADTAQ